MQVQEILLDNHGFKLQVFLLVKLSINKSLVFVPNLDLDSIDFEAFDWFWFLIFGLGISRLGSLLHVKKIPANLQRSEEPKADTESKSTPAQQTKPD